MASISKTQDQLPFEPLHMGSELSDLHPHQQTYPTSTTSSQKCSPGETAQNSNLIKHQALDQSRSDVTISIKENDWKPHASIHEFDSSKMEYYLASGHVTNFKFVEDKVYKVAKEREIAFYLDNQYESPFNPICHKIQENHLILENLLYKMPLPSVIDIKLGRHSDVFKFNSKKLEARMKRLVNTSSQKLSFRISGYVTPQQKEHNIKTKDQERMKEILKKCIHKGNVDKVLEFVKDLKKHLESHNRVYESTSLLIVSNEENVKVKWIDMSYWVDHVHPDYDLMEGLDNFCTMLGEIYS